MSSQPEHQWIRQRGATALYIVGIAFAATCFTQMACAQKMQFASAQMISDAHLVSHHLGWVRIGSHVNLTTDGGNSWRDVTPPYNANEAMSGVSFIDQNNGFVTFTSSPNSSQFEMGNNELRVAHTADGGNTWASTRIVKSQIPNDLACCAGVDVAFLDGQHGWLIAGLVTGSGISLGDLFLTVDGGKTWAPLPQPPSARLPVFVTSNVGWAVPQPADTLIKTVDGGNSWESVSVVDGATCNLKERCLALYDLPTFSDLMNGRVLVTLHRAEGGIVVSEYVTSDGGKTWEKQQSRIEENEEIATGQLRAIETADGQGMITIRTQAHLAQDHSSLSIASDDNQKTASFAPPATHSETGFRVIGFLNKSEGWLVKSDVICTAFRQCHSSTTLLTTEDSGSAYSSISPSQICPQCAASSAAAPIDEITVPKPVPPTPVPIHPVPIQPVLPSPTPGPVLTGNELSIDELGFDVGCAPPPYTMMYWWWYSPFYDIGVYLGGIHAGCSVQNGKNIYVSANWVSDMEDQGFGQGSGGWGILPIWLGLQAPASCGSLFSTNLISTTLTGPGSAYSQGQADATQAIGVAQPLGITGIIYNDMEQYTAPCLPVEYYLAGWGDTLHANGYAAGVYMNWANDINDIDSSPVLERNDAVWVSRYYNGQPILWATLFNYEASQYCSDDLKYSPPVTCYQNFSGQIPETYGGMSLEAGFNSNNGGIDGDYDQTIIAPYSGDRTIPAPSLLSPADNATISSTATVTLQTTNVPRAIA